MRFQSPLVYFISFLELIFVLNSHKDTSLSTIELINSYLETMSNHIYFCEIVYFRTFLKQKNVDLANVIGIKPY